MQANLSASQILARLEGLEPSIIDPKGRPKNVASSTFHIIFYHKIPYPKTLNPFIYRHFNHFILSNNIIQYKRDKIQHKTPHLQKSCIFLAKICSSGFIIQTLLICHKCFLWNLLDYYKHI